MNWFNTALIFFIFSQVLFIIYIKTLIDNLYLKRKNATLEAQKAFYERHCYEYLEENNKQEGE